MENLVYAEVLAIIYSMGNLLVDFNSLLTRYDLIELGGYQRPTSKNNILD